MKAKFKRMLVSLGISSALFVVPAAYSQSDDLVRKLNLTPQQQAQLREYSDANRQKAQELRQTIRDKQQALQRELQRAGADRGRINSISSEIKNLQATLMDYGVENFTQMKRILTSEQFEKFLEIRRQRGRR